MTSNEPNLSELIQNTNDLMDCDYSLGSANLEKLDSYFRDLHLIVCNCFGRYDISLEEYNQLLSLFKGSQNKYRCTFLGKSNSVRERSIVRMKLKKIRTLTC